MPLLLLLSSPNTRLCRWESVGGVGSRAAYAAGLGYTFQSSIPASLIRVIHYRPNPISGPCSSSFNSNSGGTNVSSSLVVS